MTLLRERLTAIRDEGRKALVPYVVGGFPSRALTLELVQDLAPLADVVEVGLPYSDALMDGPVIQAAARSAIASGTGPLDALDIGFDDAVPRVAMTYYNPIHRIGEEAFCTLLEQRGFHGLIVPDLPTEASLAIRDRAQGHGIAWIPLVAPTSPPRRVEQAVEGATGFVYAVSTLGVTGSRDELSDRAGGVVALCRQATDLPVYLGIGISNPDQVRSAAALADGVVVGSAIVKVVAEEGVAGAIAFVSALRDALTRL